MMIKHVCISGFTQNDAFLHGVMKLSERLREQNIVDEFKSRIDLFQWNSDWKKIAEYYWLLQEHYLEKTTICVYAYSWGAGWGAMQLAKRLARNGMYIRVMVLSDPVYRSRWFTFKFRSMLARDSMFAPIIHVPHNVQEVFNLYQTTNRPQGHRLIATNGTKIHPSIHVPNTEHQKMDDNWKFHTLSQEIAIRITLDMPLDDIQI
jgi:hypothetical protein